MQSQVRSLTLACSFKPTRPDTSFKGAEIELIRIINNGQTCPNIIAGHSVNADRNDFACVVTLRVDVLPLDVPLSRIENMF